MLGPSATVSHCPIVMSASVEHLFYITHSILELSLCMKCVQVNWDCRFNQTLLPVQFIKGGMLYVPMSYILHWKYRMVPSDFILDITLHVMEVIRHAESIVEWFL